MSQPDDDHTLDADPASIERIRELARRAAAEHAEHADRGEPGDDRTLDADESALAQLRALAAGAGPALSPPRPPRDLSELELPDPGELGARPRPAPPELAEPWRPPARSVRPAALPETAPIHATHPIWRTLALALAVVLLVLGAWLLFGGDDADDAPPGTSVPAPTGTVVTTGIIGEGGSGG